MSSTATIIGDDAAVGPRRRDPGRVRRARPPEPGEQRRDGGEQHGRQPDRHRRRPERSGRDRCRVVVPPNQRVNAATMSAAARPSRSRSRPPTRRAARSQVMTRQAAACASMHREHDAGGRASRTGHPRGRRPPDDGEQHGHEHHVGGERPDAGVDSGCAPDQPTRASSPVGSATAWITTRAIVADSATAGRRTDFMTLHRDSCWGRAACTASVIVRGQVKPEQRSAAASCDVWQSHGDHPEPTKWAPHDHRSPQV